MIDAIAYWLSVAISLAVIAVLIGAVVLGFRNEQPPRDLCKFGCGIVHSAMCEDGVIIGGVPFVCERAYSHAGVHEAESNGGWVASWKDEHPGRTRPNVSIDKMHALSLDARRARRVM